MSRGKEYSAGAAGERRPFKTLLVFGTRPEAIKMAPLALMMRKSPSFDARVCVTGQHRRMLDQVLKVFEIAVDFDLDVMKPKQDLGDVTAAVLKGLKEVYRCFKPDLVLVHGDTASTFAAALSAYHSRIEVAHIEAGLRTGNLCSPWPEEGNRKLTAALASLHFAPTEESKRNLLLEAVPLSKIFVTGNTVIDALLATVEKLRFDDALRRQFDAQFDYIDAGRRLILVTGHRRESFGGGIEQICTALKRIVSIFTDVQVVYPVHLNHNVQEPVNRLLAGVSNIHLIEPLEYLSFIYLMNRCTIPQRMFSDDADRRTGIKRIRADCSATEGQPLYAHTPCHLRTGYAHTPSLPIGHRPRAE